MALAVVPGDPAQARASSPTNPPPFPPPSPPLPHLRHAPNRPTWSCFELSSATRSRAKIFSGEHSLRAIDWRRARCRCCGVSVSRARFRACRLRDSTVFRRAMSACTASYAACAARISASVLYLQRGPNLPCGLRIGAGSGGNESSETSATTGEAKSLRKMRRQNDRYSDRRGGWASGWAAAQ